MNYFWCHPVFLCSRARREGGKKVKKSYALTNRHKKGKALVVTKQSKENENQNTKTAPHILRE